MRLSLARVIVLFVSVALMAAAVAPASGCSAGERAREDVLTPAVLGVSAGVEADAMRGARTQAQRGHVVFVMDAVRSGDRARIADEAWPVWPAVKGYALRGIREREGSGEISAGVAESLRERLSAFETALLRLAME